MILEPGGAASAVLAGSYQQPHLMKVRHYPSGSICAEQRAPQQVAVTSQTHNGISHIQEVGQGDGLLADSLAACGLEPDELKHLQPMVFLPPSSAQCGLEGRQATPTRKTETLMGMSQQDQSGCCTQTGTGRVHVGHTHCLLSGMTLGSIQLSVLTLEATAVGWMMQPTCMHRSL